MNRITKVGVLALAALTVGMSGCAGTAAHRSTGVAVDDSVVNTRVKAALIGNEQTKARQIDVEVYRGEVQLNGFVDSDAAKMAATSTAQGVEGVRSVKNNLQIKAAERSAGQVIDDGLITTKVKTALIADSRTKAYQIEVETNAGVVQLAGFVDTNISKSAAAELANSVEGVKMVSNRLELRK
jgi:hyperosmotically inducible periplasmic protein